MTPTWEERLLRRTGAGWSDEEGTSIAMGLAAAVSNYLETPLEIVYSDGSPDGRDALQRGPDYVCFRVRSRPFGPSETYCLGGIISAARLYNIPNPPADAVIFPFALGRRTSPRGPSHDLHLSFEASGEGRKMKWSVERWILDEFEEYEVYDVDYVAQLQKFPSSPS